MRKIIMLAVIAAFSTTAAPAMAGIILEVPSVSDARPVELATHYYGHKPKCVFKKVKRYDSYGKVFFKKVKICK